MKLKKPPTWRCKNKFERWQNCRVQLLIDGLLTEAENEKVRARIHKQFKKENRGQG